MKRFLITGYWFDDNTQFENYLVTDTHEVQPYDDAIFMYGITEEEILSMIKGTKIYEDFMVTSYEEIA